MVHVFVFSQCYINQDDITKKNLAHADLLLYTILLKITKYFMEPGNAIASAGF